MRVLVAGATGVIGRPLVDRLLDRGDEVVGLTRAGTALGRCASEGRRRRWSTR